MPNWCCNSLIVKGPKDHIVFFKEFAKGKDDDEDEKILDHKKFISYPEEFEGQEGFNNLDKKEKDKTKILARERMKRLYGVTNGYDFSIKYYGTKWGICSPYLAIDDKKELMYSFETAWSPPTPLVKEMSKQFPELEFTLEYEEPGMCFKGTYVVKEGKVLKDVCKDYDPEETEE